MASGEEGVHGFFMSFLVSNKLRYTKTNWDFTKQITVYEKTEAQKKYS